MADVDGDKVPEILISGIGGAIQLFDAKGKPFGRAFPNARDKYGPKSNVTAATVFVAISNPAFGDVDDDGIVDVTYGLGVIDVLLSMASGGKRRDYEMAIGAWDTKTGNFKPGFPLVVEDYQFFHTPLVADVDGDGRSQVINGSAGYFLHAIRADGTEPKGFPKFTGQWIAGTPTVGDMDGDGQLELACATRAGWLYVWKTTGTAKGRIDWDSFHHDARNTGNYDVALDQGSKAKPPTMMPTEPPKPTGCAVGADGRSGVAALLAASLLALLAQRRRRSILRGS
jgi:MYXO-CTERM domain-containing protein